MITSTKADTPTAIPITIPLLEELCEILFVEPDALKELIEDVGGAYVGGARVGGSLNEHFP